MIFLKANAELKSTFERLIQTMKASVEWNGIFAVLNNFLILPGEVRSLVFYFDNRKVNTNIIEISMEEADIESIGRTGPVTDVLNMVLYAFGKWGTIPGLRVEKDYAQLNQLFAEILRELKIESEYGEDRFRFYQNGVQMTYEDVVQAAVEAEQKEEEEEIAAEEKLGLWHNMRWVTARAAFKKSPVTAAEGTKRIGNNFYPVGYQCPKCGEKLYMAVYPVDKEFPIETDEGKVYLARAYVCDNCNCFYTPRPGKLLSEGDIYILDFAEDRGACEDYQELLGSRGERTTNHKLNEYEWERNKKNAIEAQKDQEEVQQKPIGEMEKENGEERGEELQEESGEGKHSRSQGEPGEEEARESREKPEKEKDSRKEAGKEKGSREEPGKEKDSRKEAGKEKDSRKERGSREEPAKEKDSRKEAGKEKDSRKEPGNEKGAGKEPGERERVKKQKELAEREESGKETGRQKESRQETGGEMPKEDVEALQDDKRERVRKKYDAHMKMVERMSKRQLQELREHIRKEKLLSEEEKAGYTGRIEENIRKQEEKELQRLVENAGKGNYLRLCRTIEEIKRSDYPPERKESALVRLYEMRQEKAQAEAEELLARMPKAMDRRQYQLFRDKLAQYKEADITSYEEELRHRRELAERQEIENMVKRAGRNDRGALYRVWQRLQEPDFAGENTKKPLEELYQRIQKLDEAAIDRICPDMMEMSFEEGKAAYEKISEGMFLPDIKKNALEMIDKRLIKMKSDESEMLVQKLREELKGKLTDTSCMHYNNARKAMMGEWKGPEAEILKNAENTYAAEHGRYEYPILVCDSTRHGTGREGFLLTPEHLFYNSGFSSESIPVSQIRNISFHTGILNRGIYIHQKNGEKTKIPTGIQGRDWEKFTQVFREFIKYLQEKPESRQVSYLAKEEHEVKCCYRCGYVYKGGDVCPKCGSRANK